MKGKYGEPWRVDAYGVIREHDGMPVDARSPVVHRIIACVNALDGLDPEALREFIEAAKATRLHDAMHDGGCNMTATGDAPCTCGYDQRADAFDRAAAALGVRAQPPAGGEREG